MKHLNEVELMNILDGEKPAQSLTEADMERLDDAKLAMMALQAWEEAEPIQASENFWPKLREQLPERPPRSAWNRFIQQVGAWLWPSHSPLATSMRVAMVAAIIALASFWFAPQQAITPVVADFTAEESAFIERSLERHDKYVIVDSGDGTLGIPVGDAGSFDGSESEPGSEYIP